MEGQQKKARRLSKIRCCTCQNRVALVRARLYTALGKEKEVQCAICAQHTSIQMVAGQSVENYVCRV